jgi:ribosome biogenesis protein ENP2
MRVYDFAEMSMKFERHTSAENVQFLLLSDDWTKSVHLQNDRSIEFHNQGGVQYNTRIPRFGRDLAYHYPSCDLYIAAAGDEVYRLNLEQGKFLNSLEVETAGEGVNCIDICPAHQLIGLGTEGGTVEFWDPRVRSRVGVLDVMTAEESGDSVTALAYRLDGLNLAVETHSGQTLLYDVRSPRTYLRKDQGYGLPLKKISWLDHKQDPTMQESSVRTTKSSKSGRHWMGLPSPLSNLLSTSAMYVPSPIQVSSLLPTKEHQCIPTTSLNSVPHPDGVPSSIISRKKWNKIPLKQPTITTKFVTRKELAALGLDKLVATNVVKTYMHGFFIDVRLYEQARLVANPFAYEEYREKKILEKIEKERESRIRTSAAQQFKVNKHLAPRLQERERLARVIMIMLIVECQSQCCFGRRSFQGCIHES